jgi:hypothetical protein
MKQDENEQNYKKGPMPVVALETKWEIPITNNFPNATRFCHPSGDFGFAHSGARHRQSRPV